MVHRKPSKPGCLTRHEALRSVGFGAPKFPVFPECPFPALSAPPIETLSPSFFYLWHPNTREWRNW